MQWHPPCNRAEPAAACVAVPGLGHAGLRASRPPSHHSATLVRVCDFAAHQRPRAIAQLERVPGSQAQHSHRMPRLLRGQLHAAAHGCWQLLRIEARTLLLLCEFC